MEQKIKLVRKAFENSYSPYSNFKVGACLVLKNGEYIIGTNVENASYGLSNCAERSALFAAYSNGFRKEDILEIVISSRTKEPVSPCGACRQVICELMPADAKVTLYSYTTENIVELKVSELLPYAFNEGELTNE